MTYNEPISGSGKFKKYNWWFVCLIKILKHFSSKQETWNLQIFFILKEACLYIVVYSKEKESF